MTEGKQSLFHFKGSEDAPNIASLFIATTAAKLQNSKWQISLINFLKGALAKLITMKLFLFLLNLSEGRHKKSKFIVYISETNCNSVCETEPIVYK